MRKIKSEIFYHCDVVRDYAERGILGTEPVVRHQLFQSKEDPAYSQADPFVIHDHYHSFLSSNDLPSKIINDDFN